MFLEKFFIIIKLIISILLCLAGIGYIGHNQLKFGIILILFGILLILKNIYDIYILKYNENEVIK